MTADQKLVKDIPIFRPDYPKGMQLGDTARLMDGKKNLKIRASLHQRLKLYATLHGQGVEAFAEGLIEAALTERFARRGAMDPALARTMARELAAIAAAQKKRKKPG